VGELTGAGLEVVVDAHAELGEGPVWDTERGLLLWVDITGKLIHEYDPRTGSDTSFPTPVPVGAVALRGRGGLVLAMEDGFWLWGLGRNDPKRFVPVEADMPENRMNDGKVDPAGRFWAGTMAYDQRTDHAALYRLDSDGTVQTMLSPVSLSNGMDWSPDSTVMYYADSLAHSVDAFDFDVASGDISNRRVLIRVAPDDGDPDGLCVDSEGLIWLAVWGASEVQRYTPAGDLVSTVRLPVTQVTSVAFGGEDLMDLYITSAAENLGEDELRRQPSAGALFRCRPGVKGRPPFRFRG
jgi:sugar lactone lactonase YvrE